MVGLVGHGGAQLLRPISDLVLARLFFPEAVGIIAIVCLVIFATEQTANLGIQATILHLAGS